MNEFRRMAPRLITAPARRLVAISRRMTWRWRSDPNFIILGAQKAGTTSLFHYLRQHPQIFPSFVKEVHFFDGGLDPAVDTFAAGQQWYRAQFPLGRTVGPAGRAFEASPLYLFSPLVAPRIRAMLPAVRLIAVLRNPTKRAVSHYFHAAKHHPDPLPMLEAMQREEERLAPAIARRDFKDDVFIQRSYKARGVYRPQLERFLEFFPRDRLLVLTSEELAATPDAVLRRVYEFVGVDPDVSVRDRGRQNVTERREPVPEGVMRYLDDYFRPHNEALFALLGERYAW